MIALSFNLSCGKQQERFKDKRWPCKSATKKLQYCKIVRWTCEINFSCWRKLFEITSENRHYCYCKSWIGAYSKQNCCTRIVWKDWWRKTVKVRCLWYFFRQNILASLCYLLVKPNIFGVHLGKNAMVLTATI